MTLKRLILWEITSASNEYMDEKLLNAEIYFQLFSEDFCCHSLQPADCVYYVSFVKPQQIAAEMALVCMNLP